MSCPYCNHLGKCGQHTDRSQDDWREHCRRLTLQRDRVEEEFAAFVFFHFGGYWTNPPLGRVDPLGQNMAKLPGHILDRVKALAEEHRKAKS